MSFLETAWVSWAIAIVAVVIVYIAKTYTFWARQGVVQTWPRPIFGDVWDAFIRRCSLGDLLIKMYRKYNDVPFVGFYKFLTPAILVRDPDLVKEVLSQNFASFQNNETILKEGADVLMSENPFAVGMDRWKDLRMRISTLFNPSRTRLAFDELLASSDHLVQFLKDSEPDKVQDGFEIARRYTAYASARVLFGIESNSLEVNSPPGTFFDAGMALFNGGLLNALRFTAFFYSPFWLKVIGSTFASESTFLFFRNLIRDSIEYRQKHNINRDDFIEYASKQVYADGEINDKLLNKLTSQAVNSFSETFETSGITVGATLLLLATNPDKQNKLRADLLKATMGKKLTLDDINGLPYLDWVVKEMLRLFPILDTTRRRCTQATTLGSGATAVQLQPGTPVYIPVLALHYDPTLYERPEDFHPEHFSPEQVAARPKCTFLGFGEGPRACPGSRYAYVLVKVALAQVVLNFRLSPGPQVVLPIKRDPTANFVNFIGGNWIQFKPLA